LRHWSGVWTPTSISGGSDRLRHLLSLRGLTRSDLDNLFSRADAFVEGVRPDLDGVALLFFPPASLRTRVSFERGAAEMGLQPVTLPPEALDSGEDPADIARYAANWATLAVVRHREMAVLERMAGADALPVVNAMTGVNHPCEVLSDLYAIAQTRDIFGLRYLFIGPDGNIGRGWQEAAQAFGLDIRQCCPPELAVPGMIWSDDLANVIRSADVVITDGPGGHGDAMMPFQVTASLLDTAPSGVMLNPCPPFIRGREVAGDAIEHPAFVGHAFKQYLKPVQQAIMVWVLDG
jgi:ornithine carbamoyltransferase